MRGSPEQGSEFHDGYEPAKVLDFLFGISAVNLT